MMGRILRIPGRASRHHEALEASLSPEPFATTDQVLLCCFGLDQSTERSNAQLRSALVEVGFRSPEAREIVRTSPLVPGPPRGRTTSDACTWSRRCPEPASKTQ